MREFIDSLIQSSGIFSELKVQVSGNNSGLENIRRIRPSQYVVWTQAGFKKACREVVKRYDPDLTRNFRKYIEGFPKSYPSLVEFHDGYKGYRYWIVKCSSIDDAIQKYKNEIELLEDIKRQHQAKIDNLKGNSQNGNPLV